MTEYNDYEVEVWEGDYGMEIIDHPLIGKAVRRLPGVYAGKGNRRAPAGTVGAVKGVKFDSGSDRFPYKIVWFLSDYSSEWLNHKEFEVCDG